MCENGVIYHHGILGMKWGVRRTPEQLGRVTKGAGEENRKHFTSKKKRVNEALSAMSDEELSKSLDRLRKEEEFKRLSGVRTNSNNIQNGKSFSKVALEDVGKKVISSAALAGVVYAGNKALDKLNKDGGSNAAGQILDAILKRL